MYSLRSLPLAVDFDLLRIHLKFYVGVLKFERRILEFNFVEQNFDRQNLQGCISSETPDPYSGSRLRILPLFKVTHFGFAPFFYFLFQGIGIFLSRDKRNIMPFWGAQLVCFILFKEKIMAVIDVRCNSSRLTKTSTAPFASKWFWLRFQWCRLSLLNSFLRQKFCPIFS